ncbi:IclR family transcriptional regulator [Pseudonocardia sp. GCM10023141]|uniref:IclR family transcriptional regulator n=1 Tax=Pseudonocardia sp. GCM10023141 TaxID=3252653 RepID=UPI00360A8434
MNQPRNSAGSVRKALSVLQHVAGRGGGGVGLTELATALGHDKSTVLRLCTPLLEADLLQRDAGTGRFGLGPGTVRLGQHYLDGLDLRTVAAPQLTRLLEQTGSTCHLVVRDGLDVVYIDKKENTAVVRMASRIGHRLPLHCTAVGKSILAFGPADLVDEAVAAGLRAITDRTIAEPTALRAELTRVRRRGYAIDDRENEPDVRCVAAPVFDHAGHIAGAVSVSAWPPTLPRPACGSWVRWCAPRRPRSRRRWARRASSASVPQVPVVRRPQPHRVDHRGGLPRHDHDLQQIAARVQADVEHAITLLDDAQW